MRPASQAASLGRFLRTLIYLKPIQVAYQLRHRSRWLWAGQWQRSRARHLRPMPEPPPLRQLAPRIPFLARRWIRRSDIQHGRFRFLNQDRTFAGQIDWRVADATRLWRYHLHYFDYLFPDLPLPSSDGFSLMHAWSQANPKGMPDAWDAFPISLRTVNWIKFFLIHHQDGSGADNALLASLYQQIRHLDRHLEFHLLGNHLLKNIKALVIAGLFFSGKAAARWRRRGFRLLEKQVTAQILADGGHIERSPMYHAMILEDLLDLLNLLPASDPHSVALSARLAEIAHRMVFFLTHLSHPDGQIALFNDAAFGIEHAVGSLTDYYHRLTNRSAPVARQTPLTAFPQSGYFVMAPADGYYLVVDCGAIGPDYLPGHSHCDTLSFELSIRHRRVIVDSGCCHYLDGPMRQYNRGNAGHNTVTIDGINQSEVWGAHRCARRAAPSLHGFGQKGAGELYFSGSHDGYARLPGHPVHQRTIRWHGRRIEIDDQIHGSGIHEIATVLHLHPDLYLSQEGAVIRVADAEGPLMSIRARDRLPLEIDAGWYCPEFNRRQPCPKIVSARQTVLPISAGWRIDICCA